MKRGTPNHPKTFHLADLLGIKRRDAVGLLEMLFHFTAEYAPMGDIGRFDDRRIAAAVDWHGSSEKLIHGLVGAKWIDTHSEVRLIVHDWSDHADRSTHRRLARLGKSTIQQNHEDTRKVTPHVGPPEAPLPLPEPVPVPEPHIGATAERMYALHPKKKNLVLVAGALIAIVKKSGIPSLEEIEKCHAAWCKTEGWQEANGRFAPKLDEWIADRGFTQWPNGSQPRKKPAVSQIDTSEYYKGKEYEC